MPLRATTEGDAQVTRFIDLAILLLATLLVLAFLHWTFVPLWHVPWFRAITGCPASAPKPGKPGPGRPARVEKPPPSHPSRRGKEPRQDQILRQRRKPRQVKRQAK